MLSEVSIENEKYDAQTQVGTYALLTITAIHSEILNGGNRSDVGLVSIR